MSADNFIAIQKYKGKWYVWVDCASSPQSEPCGAFLRRFRKFRKAINYAIKLNSNEVIEYGIQFLPDKKKG